MHGCEHYTQLKTCIRTKQFNLVFGTLQLIDDEFGHSYPNPVLPHCAQKNYHFEPAIVLTPGKCPVHLDLSGLSYVPC